MPASPPHPSTRSLLAAALCLAAACRPLPPPEGVLDDRSPADAEAPAPDDAAAEPPAEPPSEPTPEPPPADPIDAWLDAPFAPADGFDLPIGDGDGGGSYVDAATGTRHHGWYVATTYGEEYSLGIHPAEDWNGRGGGETDRGQPVHTIGVGRVVVADRFGQPWGGIVVVEHLFYENHRREVVRSLYAHLDRIDVTVGQLLERREQLGTIGSDPLGTFPAHLHLELRTDTSLSPTFWPSDHGWDQARIDSSYLPPSDWIAARRSLFVPQREAVLLVAHAESYRMRRYELGVQTDELQIGLGQGRARKRIRGDNGTPRGMYFVVNRHRGPIGGEWGAYYGEHWIKVNYPNRWDAAWGRSEGLIGDDAERRIRDAWGARELTPQDTRLGSGIGLHGWIREWEDDGPRHLSWGCVVMHNRDITRLFDDIPAGAMVVIL